MVRRSLHVLSLLCRTSGFFQYNAAGFGKLFSRRLVVDCTVLASTAPDSPSTVVAKTSATMAGLTPGMRVHHDAYVELAGVAPLLQPLNSVKQGAEPISYCAHNNLASSLNAAPKLNLV